MNHETKVTRAFSRLHNDYVRFIGPEAVGFYFSLLYLNDRSLGADMTPEYISLKTYLSVDRMKKMMKMLKASKLVTETRAGDKWVYKLENPKLLTREAKLDLIHVLADKNIIEEDEKISMIDYINVLYGANYHQGDIPKETKDVDFSDVKEINPDTALALVDYYYDFLSETFGAKYPSRNGMIEARNLKEVMKKNGDTPEITREFFRWIITRAKQKEQFEQVSSLGLYPEYRKHAHYAITVAGKKDAKFAPEVSLDNAQSDESIQENIQKVFAIYKDKGMTIDDIENKLRSNFSESAVDKFFEEVPSGN